MKTIRTDLSFTGLGGNGGTGGMNVNNMVAFGGRIGYWFDSLPWLGFAVDALEAR